MPHTQSLWLPIPPIPESQESLAFWREQASRLLSRRGLTAYRGPMTIEMEFALGKDWRPPPALVREVVKLLRDHNTIDCRHKLFTRPDNHTVVAHRTALMSGAPGVAVFLTPRFETPNPLENDDD